MTTANGGPGRRPSDRPGSGRRPDPIPGYRHDGQWACRDQKYARE